MPIRAIDLQDKPPREPMRPRGGIARRDTKRIMREKPAPPPLNQARNNAFGFYERNKLMSPITNVELPKSARKLTYDYSADLENVKTMIAEGGTPGDGPFETQGKARAAANSLLEQLGEDGKKYGARVVQKSEEANADKPEEGGWYFGLKLGRKEFKGRTDKPATGDDGKPKTTGNRK